MSDSHAAGASKSLKLTIKELESYLAGEHSELTDGIRQELNNKLANYALWWFREGFAIAHYICLERLKNGESIEQIEFEDSRAWLAPGVDDRSIRLKAPAKGRPDMSWEI